MPRLNPRNSSKWSHGASFAYQIVKYCPWHWRNRGVINALNQFRITLHRVALLGCRHYHKLWWQMYGAERNGESSSDVFHSSTTNPVHFPLSQCQTVWRFSSLTPVLSYYQVQIVLLGSAILKSTSWNYPLAVADVWVLMTTPMSSPSKIIEMNLFILWMSFLSFVSYDDEYCGIQLTISINIQFYRLKRYFLPHSESLPSFIAVGVQFLKFKLSPHTRS